MRRLSQAIPPSVRLELQRPVKTARRPRNSALPSGVLLLVFFAVLYGAVPGHLPLLIQRLVGMTRRCWSCCSSRSR